MWIAPVQVAAPVLPGAASSAAAPGDAPLFDDALDASLQGELCMPRADGQAALPAEGAALPPVFDRRALVAWMLLGKPAAAAAVPSTVEASPETEVDEDALQAAEVQGDPQPELPVDVLFVAPVQPQQLPAVPPVEVAAATVEQQAVRTVRLTSNVTPVQEPASAQDATPVQHAADAQDAAPAQDAAQDSRFAQDARPAQDATPAAAETAKAQTTQAAPAREAAAAEPHKVIRLRPETVVTTDGMRKPDTAENRDAMPGAEPSAPQDRSAGASTPGTTQTVAGARVTTGAKAPVLPVAAVAQPVVTESSAPIAAEAASIVQPLVQDVERETRDTTAGSARVSVLGTAVQAGAVKLEAQVGGGDAQGFEQDRRSSAGQRLAAALSALAPPRGQDAGTGSTPAPVFSVAQPAAPVTPIATPVPVTATAPAPADVDAANVHSLVQAMHITAKAGGWEATVRLNPDHLGEVTIALRVEGKNVSAVVQADSAGVRQWLTSQEDAVRSGLSEQGLHLERFAVSKDGQRREAEQQPQQEQQRRRAPRQAATGSEQQQRFEVVV